MNKLIILSLALAAMLAACTPYMYGVPQETWDRMSEAERIEAIRAYEQEQKARRLAAEERARRLALEQERERARQAALAREHEREMEIARQVARERERELERERARQAALERERRERIEAIHRGEGAYGELIRVRLQGGRMRIGGHHRRFEPLTFTIAAGETRRIPVTDKKGREVDLVVSYTGGALTVEGVRFPYDRSWGRGRLYPDTSTAGPLELRGVDVSIDVHTRSSRFEREIPRLVIIHEEPPPVVVVREPRPPVTPPVVVVRETPPPAPKPPAPPLKQEPPKTSPPVRSPSPAVAERAPRQVDIALLSGDMKLRGQHLKLERTSLRIAEGESRELTVSAGGEKATITVQYRNGELTFDGNPGRGREAVRFRFSQEWQRGKAYNFDIKGRIHLEKVEVRVTGVTGK